MTPKLECGFEPPRSGGRGPVLKGTRAQSARRLAVGIFAAVGFLVIALSVFPQPLDWWLDALAGPWQEPHGDTLIVLAAGSSVGGVPSVSSYRRAVTAAQAWRTGGFRRVMVCGGHGTPPQSVPMRNLLVYLGVPVSAIASEDESASTRDNAVNAQRFLGSSGGTLVLMTSDFHMYRAIRCFRRVGLHPLPWLVLDAGRYEHRLQPSEKLMELTRETAKILYYRWQGWI